MKIDATSIKQLAKLLTDTGLTEIEVAEGDSKIRVKKDGAGGVLTYPVAGTGYAPAYPSAMGNDPGAPGRANTAPPQANPEDHPGAITSPMVGTCYLCPEPGAKAFAQKGDMVKVGDTLCIIEAMKVMNPIKAEKAGTVLQVVIKDAQPVEFGDVLMVIE
jgi:acetyl-CoA carboxylase biotin carboxyl carrier protein